jgi:hypothetical protein
MKNIIKHIIISLILLWSVTVKSFSDQGISAYTIKNGRMIPINNTSQYTDLLYKRSTNSKNYFNKILLDKNGKEILE